METFDEYRKRAEQAEKAAASARDPQAKRYMEISAQRWWQLAKLVSGKTNHQKVDPPKPARPEHVGD